jgi:hypothetical protein
MIGYDSAFIGGTLALPLFVSEFGWGTKQKSVDEVNFLKAMLSLFIKLVLSLGLSSRILLVTSSAVNGVSPSSVWSS